MNNETSARDEQDFPKDRHDYLRGLENSTGACNFISHAGFRCCRMQNHPIHRILTKSETSARVEGESGMEMEQATLLDAQLAGMSLEQRIAVRSQLMRAGLLTNAAPEPKVGESGLSDEQVAKEKVLAATEERGWLPEVLHRASLESLAILWVQDKATDQELRDLRDVISKPTPEAKPEPLPNTLQEDQSSFHAWLDRAKDYGIEFTDGGETMIWPGGSGPVVKNIEMHFNLAAPKVVDSKEYICTDPECFGDCHPIRKAKDLPEVEMTRKFTERGFEDFVEFRDSYGSLVTIRESSNASGPHVWIFCKDAPQDPNPSPHLTIEQAKLVSDALLAFITRVEEQDGERELPLITRIKAAVAAIDEMKAKNRFVTDEDIAIVFYGNWQDALRESKLLKPESVAPPSLPKKYAGDYLCEKELHYFSGGSCIVCGTPENAAAPVALPNLECGDEEHLDPAIKLLADVMNLWVDGYISKNPKSMAPDSISSDVFEAVERFLSTHEIAVDYCGWHIKPVARPMHQLVERTIADDDYVGLRCSCGRTFIGGGAGALARTRASFEAHLPEKEGK